MQKYCKAYFLRDIRQFQDWTEKQEGNEEELSEETVVYLWDDFTVVRSPVIPDKGLLFDQITPQWQAFCQETLKFVIPEDLRYAYEQSEEQQEAPEVTSKEQGKDTVIS
jgi:hypothetical protein